MTRGNVADTKGLAPAFRGVVDVRPHHCTAAFRPRRAAVLEGALIATQVIDVWLGQIDEDRICEATADAGGFSIPGFGGATAAFGGEGLDRIDVVLTAHGLRPFPSEYAGAIEREIEGVTLRVLPLARVIESKRATGRLKDTAALPVLEATLKARGERGE